MIESDDLYEILEVHPLAEQEVIQGAYQKLAPTYHPDTSKNYVEAHWLKFQNAYEILKDPQKRKEYDLIRNSKKVASSQKKQRDIYSEEPPALHIVPKHIVFKDMKYGDIKITYFDVNNIGGQYDKITIVDDYLPKWLQITDYKKLSDQALPIRVNIKAIGQVSVSQYECYISVKIEKRSTNFVQEVKVHVELLMKESIPQATRTQTSKSYEYTSKSTSATLKKCNKCGKISLWYNRYSKKWECLNRRCRDYNS